MLLGDNKSEQDILSLGTNDEDKLVSGLKAFSFEVLDMNYRSGGAIKIGHSDHYAR